MSFHSKLFINLFRQGDILAFGYLVQSSLAMIQFQSPPTIPDDLELIIRVGMVFPQKLSLMDLVFPSVPEGRYIFPRVKSSISKVIILPDSCNMTFSTWRQNLIREAVPYLLLLFL